MYVWLPSPAPFPYRCTTSDPARRWIADHRYIFVNLVCGLLAYGHQEKKPAITLTPKEYAALSDGSKSTIILIWLSRTQVLTEMVPLRTIEHLMAKT